MSLFCQSDDHDGSGEWWWYLPEDEAPLATRNRRKCCSCRAPIRPGEVSRKIRRFRPPTEFEDTRGIACDEVALAHWYLCETCGDLADSLTELGFCFELGGRQTLKQQIGEYMEMSK